MTVLKQFWLRSVCQNLIVYKFDYITVHFDRSNPFPLQTSIGIHVDHQVWHSVNVFRALHGIYKRFITDTSAQF